LVEDQLTRVQVIPRPVLGVACADASRALQMAMALFRFMKMNPLMIP
jgi:hypothetical protein